MKVLVTGTKGQLVQSLAERAVDHVGIEIMAAGRPELDLELSATIASAIGSAAPDVVINAAAYTAVDQAEDEPERAFRINAVAAGELAAVTRAAGIPIVQVSTDYVFDGSGDGSYREEDAVSPLGVYGRSKLEGEQRVREGNPQHLILRTAWVYSPFGRNFVRTMLNVARQRDLLTVVDDQIGNPSSALDLADGLLTVLSSWRRGEKTGLGETYHLAGGGAVSWRGFAEHVVEESRRLGGPTATVRPIRTADWPTKARRPLNSRLNCEKFARDFGYRMPDWHASAPLVVRRLLATAGESGGKVRPEPS